MFKEITEEDWVMDYQPIENHIEPEGSFEGHMFETYGEELDFVLSHDTHNIWTYIDGDSGNPVIVNGYSLVNRIGYFITDVPWSEGDTINVSLVDYDEDDFLAALTETEGL
jgi:hypothetical protein